MRHVALAQKFVAVEVGRVVVVDATCHVGLEAVVGGQDEVVDLEDLQDVILAERWREEAVSMKVGQQCLLLSQKAQLRI